MKTAVLTNISRSAGGLFYSVRALSKSLYKLGEDIRIYSFRDQYTDEDIAVWEPLAVDVYPAVSPLQYSRRLRQMLRSAHPDLIHVHGIWLDNQWAALDVQKKTGCKVIISPRGMLDPWALQNSAWKKKIASWLFAGESMQKAAVMHALCESEYESMRAYGLKNPIAVIPNGFDLPQQTPVKISGDGPRQMLFMSRLHPNKGIPNLLHAWADSRREGWQLIIAGWDQGGHDLELKALCAELKLSYADNFEEDRLVFDAADVIFVGSKYGHNKDLLLRRADAFILPSYSEGLPMAVLEAWVYSLPVIMTPQCNLPEGFCAHAAIRIDPETASIKQGLQQFFASSEAEKQQLGQRGLQLVKDRFTWDKIGEEMQRVYHWTVNGGEIPASIRMK